ncbi:pVII [Lizard adenovirus 2]|uniref:PVII n=1 Tax=Lizard adenovirus 2 TaxID=874272 RepID=A0A076FTB0_9ADEN|nr:pVII [Lizard adenovirus 2]AII22568.1 pVII [Lizard adenovirus 2]
MSILISPSDNTGWGLGNCRIRGTGARFTLSTPVPVRHYYRAQWGSKTGRVTEEHLRRNLRKYRRRHHRRSIKTDRLLRSTPDTILIETAKRVRRTAHRRARRTTRGGPVLVKVSRRRRGPRLRYTRRI